MDIIQTDYLIIGSGIAGLTTALKAASYGKVTVLCKDSAEHCNTSLAQGGVAAAIGESDSPSLHFADTLAAGANLCRTDTVRILTEEGPNAARELLQWGVQFDLSVSGKPALAREGAHSLARVLHHGDDTGAEIWRVLFQRLTEQPDITLQTNYYVTELIVSNGHCIGAYAVRDGKFTCFLAKGVVLATGGCGHIFGRTTNSRLSTGDGLTLAWRAGAVLTDLEFVQFHPTALNIQSSPLFLISEAVRGEGAVLINSLGKKFMQNSHPMADLAPRDVVSRAIAAEQANGREVFLDTSSLGDLFPKRFPKIYQHLLQLGIDPCHIPVTPAAHFMIGGIKTDNYGRTSLPGLFASGETAGTGVHGANRLASNSLLEGLVFGARVAKVLAIEPGREIMRVPKPSTSRVLMPLREGDLRLASLQEIMWSKVGITRDGRGLAEAGCRLTELERLIRPEELELKSMLRVGKLITEAAAARLESRGSHFRSDFPQQDPAWQQKHLSPRRYTA